jgi:hypothetical protein
MNANSFSSVYSPLTRQIRVGVVSLFACLGEGLNCSFIHTYINYNTHLRHNDSEL